jgi:hypothetical protein
MSTTPSALSPLEQLTAQQSVAGAPSTQTPPTNLSPLEQLTASTAKQTGNAAPPSSDTWSNWNPDQTLSSYGAATRAAVGGLASDTVDAVKGAANFLKPTPQNDDEQTAFGVAGLGGMYAHRIFSSLKGAVVNPIDIASAIHDINNSKDPTGTYLKIAQKTASQGAGQALTALATEGVVKGVGAVAPKAAGLARDVIQGEDVAQPGTQAAVRSGVQASTEAAGTADESVAANIKSNPIVNGGSTVVDEPLATLREQEQAAYAKVDDAVGFDLKAEKAQLANDQFKLKQLGNTDADVTARGNLTDSINDSQDRITEAEQTLRDGGIDPDEADTLHQQRMAGQDFRKSLVKNTNAGDGSLNVDGLLNDAKNLQNSKFGNRLEQFMGKDGAANYVDQLQKMQKQGASAAKAQSIAKTIGKYVGIGAASAVGLGGVAHLAGKFIP